ncbi:hypothetical protein [Pantoea sp. 1B4]|nr:hypothetical protein [Pantoea sp. 1B4]
MGYLKGKKSSYQKIAAFDAQAFLAGITFTIYCLLPDKQARA